jgi:hypothetical protein
MAGYSGTPLPRKLGIKAKHRVALIGSPTTFRETLAPLPEEVEVRTDLGGRGSFDVIVWFVPNLDTLTGRFAKVASRLATTGGLWVAWPKMASGVATDLNEANVQRVGLDGGLVDNKVCAVDEVWSGLRFVVRLADR